MPGGVFIWRVSTSLQISCSAVYVFDVYLYPYCLDEMWRVYLTLIYILTDLMPSAVEAPGATLKPSSSGKGMVCGLWMTTRTPASGLNWGRYSPCSMKISRCSPASKYDISKATATNREPVLILTQPCKHNVSTDTQTNRQPVLTLTQPCKHNVSTDTPTNRQPVLTLTQPCKHNVSTDTPTNRQPVLILTQLCKHNVTNTTPTNRRMVLTLIIDTSTDRKRAGSVRAGAWLKQLVYTAGFQTEGARVSVRSVWTPA